MDRHFKRLIDSLVPAYRVLIEADPVRAGSLPRQMPEAGVYLFSEKGRDLYVGRTNRLRARLSEHSRPSSGHASAPFAFRLARKSTGRTKASYQTKGSRSDLERDPEFQRTFARQKERVRRMEIRYVEERDPLRQALLEIYVSVALGTPHNDFDTH